MLTKGILKCFKLQGCSTFTFFVKKKLLVEVFLQGVKKNNYLI